MTGRGVDQILPHPSKPVLHESYVQSALDYVAMAERANGPIVKPVEFPYIWGDALEELDRVAPVARIVNLETSITTCDEYEPKGINYRMHPANIGCLTAAKIDCCVLANNHVGDWGRPGLEQTIRTLRKADIKTAGAGRNLKEAARPAIIDVVGNSRVLVFSVGTACSGIERDQAATDSMPGVAFLTDFSDASVTLIAEQVREVKQPGDLAVFSIHWGENWGYEIPPRQRRFAHGLVDRAAVDLVHGHSSHHPKGIEIYKGKPIFYGCGDFLNDYEGISGYEGFRSHLVLAYFPTMDPGTKTLSRLEMTAFEVRRLRLQRAQAEDAAWLQGLLTREGARLGTWANLDSSGRLTLEWRN